MPILLNLFTFETFKLKSSMLHYIKYGYSTFMVLITLNYKTK